MYRVDHYRHAGVAVVVLCAQPNSMGSGASFKNLVNSAIGATFNWISLLGATLVLPYWSKSVRRDSSRSVKSSHIMDMVEVKVDGHDFMILRSVS
jgi:hypothetical protein